MKRQTVTHRKRSSSDQTSASVLLRGIGISLTAIVANGVGGCSLITHTSLDDCAKNGECEEVVACDPTSDTCDAGAGGSSTVDPLAPAGTGGADPVTGSGGSTGAGTGTGGTTPKPECVPATEVCNGIDDDCNQVIDDGCPSAFAWNEQVEEAPVGDGFGGAYFGVSCGSDELAVGLRVKVGSFFEGVGVLCSQVAVQPNSQTIPYEYGLHLEEPNHLAAHNTDGTTSDLVCDEGYSLVGVRAALQNYNNGSTDFVVLTRIWIRCAPVSLDAGSGEVVVSLDNAYEEGPVSGSFANNTAWFGEYESTRIVSGIHGMGGSWIDRIGLKTADGAVH